MESCSGPFQMLLHKQQDPSVLLPQINLQRVSNNLPKYHIVLKRCLAPLDSSYKGGKLLSFSKISYKSLCEQLDLFL